VDIHLYRINVEFPAAIWSVVLSLSDPPRVGDTIDVKGTGCVVREVVEQPRGESESTVAANVYADPVGDAPPR
jgi:hypothetical protein